MNESVIRLSLTVENNLPDIYFEMNRNELDEFINELDVIQKVILLINFKGIILDLKDI
jgi:hypothetical protein